MGRSTKRQKDLRHRCVHRLRLQKKSLKRIHDKNEGDEPWVDRLLSWCEDNVSRSSLEKLKMMLRRGYRNPCRVSDLGRISVEALRKAGLVVVVDDLCIIVKQSKLERIVTGST